MRAALVVLLLVASAIAGCVTPPAATQDPNTSGTPSALPDMSDLTEPTMDTERARLWWEAFVKGYPYRHAGTPTNIQASEQIAADLAEAGYEVLTFFYVPATNDPSPIPAGIRTIVGVKKGSVEPEKVVGWVAHYDSHQTTIEAAYDDGSGTAVAMELARTLAAYDNRKTLMPIFFDAEEVGLVASAAFVKQAMQDDSYQFDFIIGHDMTGINCPGHEWPMYQMMGENFADLLFPIEEAIYRDAMKIDYGIGEDAKNCIVLLDVHDRNSDERRFKEAGVPIVRMAGGRRAADYPEYHMPGDTVEFVYQYMGGPENYEKGLDTVLRASWWNVVVFDRLPSLT